MVGNDPKISATIKPNPTQPNPTQPNPTQLTWFKHVGKTTVLKARWEMIQRSAQQSPVLQAWWKTLPLRTKISEKFSRASSTVGKLPCFKHGGKWSKDERNNQTQPNPTQTNSRASSTVGKLPCLKHGKINSPTQPNPAQLKPTQPNPTHVLQARWENYRASSTVGNDPKS